MNKILIAIPCMGTVPVQFAECLLNMDKPEGTKVCFKAGSLIYDARNLISLKAIQEGYDYVLWLDSDMTFPADTLTRLLEYFKQTAPEMVTGLYFKRTAPVLPVIYDELAPPTKGEDGHLIGHLHEFVNYPENVTFPVKGCGFGCVMTSVPLLKRVWDNFGPAFSPMPWFGEDISFCRRVNMLYEDDYEERGVQKTIWCDSRIKCGHIGSFLYTEELFKRSKKE